MQPIFIVLWLSPLALIAAGYFTSRIRRFQWTRFCLVCLVLFLAFLFDLQSLSFSSEAADLALSFAVLLALSDLIWRVARKKNRIVRAAAVVTGVTLFAAAYHAWFLSGPRFAEARISAECLARQKGKKEYVIRKRIFHGVWKADSTKLVLYRRRLGSLLEQRCSYYTIPEGYENASFSFAWSRTESAGVVRIIGDADTLWTLTGYHTPR